MRIADALRNAGLPAADAEILLAHALGTDRAWLLAHGDDALSDGDATRWEALRQRRETGEPVAYILGKKDFYGRPFAVDRRVLVPRPATEGLVETTLAFLDNPADAVRPIDSGIVAVSHAFRPEQIAAIVDVGTGSGCIAVTLALERPGLHAYASDESPDALAVARANAASLGARVEFRLGPDLSPFADLRETFLLVSNPPYIPEGTALDRDVAEWEPHGALFSGIDGADMLRRLTRAAEDHPYCAGIVVECREGQVRFLGGSFFAS